MEDVIHKNHKSLREAFEKYINSTKKEGFLVFNGSWYALISFHFFVWRLAYFFVWTLVLPLSVMSKQQVLKSQSLKSVWTPCLNLSFKIFQQHLISPLACMTEPFQHKLQT